MDALRSTTGSLRSQLDPESLSQLTLQRRSRANLRRHLRRAFVRITVLMIGDGVAMYLVRAILRGARDHAFFGSGIAGELGKLLPRGNLTGWQILAALVLGLLVTGNYAQGDRRKDPGRLLLGCALAIALPIWRSLWGVEVAGSAVEYLLTTTLVWIGLLIERFTIDSVVLFVRGPRSDVARSLFVGPAEACRRAMAGEAFSGDGEFMAVGILDVDTPAASGTLGHIDDLRRVLHHSGADTVVICGPLPDEAFHAVVDASLAAACHLISVPRSVSLAGVTPTLLWRSGQPIIELTRPALKGQQLALKRALDVVGSCLALALLSPLLVGLWVLVRVDSTGPALFSQVRLGRNGRTFRCLKFRSMRVDAEKRLRSDPVLYAQYVANSFKLPANRDPRLTHIGRFLRKSSLDELPQLVNVLRGEMSLVGPRPIVPEELQEYGRWAPLFLSLKPGITGAWAVNGRSHVDYPNRADLELNYARNWSLLTDIAILLKTVPVVLRRVGAH